MKKVIEWFMIGLIIITIIFNILFNTIYNLSIEYTLYNINNIELKREKQCILNSDGSLNNRLNKCLQDSITVGPTSDTFVLDLKTMKVIWDNSVDCKTSKTMYLTKDSICKLAKNPESCIKLSNIIKKGYKGSYYWQFDDSTEYDSWVILPNETYNFDGTPRAIDGIKDQIVLVQGSQKDEFEQYIKYIKYLVNIFTIVLLVIFTILYAIVRKLNECISGSVCKYQR